MSARAGLAVVGAVILGSLALAGTALAGAAPPGSNANATGLIVGGGRVATADCPPGGNASNPGGTFGLVTVGLLTAECTNAGANASAAEVTVGTLRLGLVQSQCTTGPTGTASSSVAVIEGGGALNGTVVSGPATIDLGVIQVFLNETGEAGGFRFANAVRIVAAGQEIIVAQSRCSTAAYPLQAGLGVGSDLGGQPVSAADEAGSSAPTWLFVLAAAVLLVAAQATFLPSLLRRRRVSQG